MQANRDKKLAPIKGRIHKYLKDSGISQSDFFSKVGVSESTFRGLAGESEFKGDTIAKFLSVYKEAPIEWILLGDSESRVNQMLPASAETGIPLIPVDAMAGWLTGEVQISPDDLAYYHLPNFKGADFIIRVKGDSMQPKYFSGDLAVCKKLPLQDLFFQWGKTYVLDTEQGALIKRIDRGESAETINLISYNKEYAPFELHRSSIYNVALVMGIIREE